MLSSHFTDKNFKHVFWDVETCCVNVALPINKIWQIGFLVCEGETILEEHNYYLRWNPLPITKGAAFVTKFDRDDYERKAVDPEPILNLFESYLYNPEYYILGHNLLGFDIFLHNIWRQLHGKKSDWSYLPRVIDTNALAKGIKKGLKYRAGEDLLSYQYKMASIIEKGLKTNLTLLGQEQKIDVDYTSVHNALNDIKLNKLVWDKWIKWNLES